MKIYAYMTKGEGKVICQDCVLVGNNILSEGYLEYVPAENETVVVAVADGVGGNMAGEVASFLAVYGLKDARLFQGATIEHTGKVIKNINQSILNLAGHSRIEWVIWLLRLQELSIVLQQKPSSI